MIQAVADYFATIPSLHRALILAGGITFFWMIETFVPLFHFSYNKWKHAALNIFFTITTIIVNFAFALLIVMAADFVTEHHFGLLYIVHLPTWLYLLIGLMLLDLVGAYFIHWLEHKVKWMWKFHMVHHADQEVDTTTANRHHPGESVFRAVFTIIAVLVSGASIWLVFLYQSVSVVLSQFNHANIKLPVWLDKAISYIIVSPDMHKVHHHYIRPETDTNYGNIFSFWDRLFKTFYFSKRENLKYGLDVLEGHNVNSISDQLKLPFNSHIKTDD